MEEFSFSHIPLFNTLKRKINVDDSMYHVAYEPPYDNWYHDLYNDLFYKNIVFKNNLSNGYYVEIGALDGVVNSQSFIFEKIFKWNGIIVEPHPIWYEKRMFLKQGEIDVTEVERIRMFRDCIVSNCAISNKTGKSVFECRKIHAYSGLKSNTSDSRKSDIEDEMLIETKTLIDLLDTYNSPDVIDWVAIDTEGGEYDILSHYFKNNKKYKINLISFESGIFENMTNLLFDSQPYLKIRNPYLDFLKLSEEYGLVKFQPITGEFFKSQYLDPPIENIDNLSDVDFEHYYIHKDYLEKNPNLEKFIIK